MRGNPNKHSVPFKRDAVASIAGAVGPANAPSVPNAANADGTVTLTWTASPASFPDGYDLHYTRDGRSPVTIRQATSPVVVAVENGVEVCGRLCGYDGGVRSEWSAFSCAVAGAAAAGGGGDTLPDDCDDLPASNATKGELVAWLDTAGITIDDPSSFTKAELWTMINDYCD